MSRSILQCKQCHKPVAYRHHSGNIRPAGESVKVLYLVDGRLSLTCSCGALRVITPESGARAA